MGKGEAVHFVQVVEIVYQKEKCIYYANDGRGTKEETEGGILEAKDRAGWLRHAIESKGDKAPKGRLP